MDREHLENHYRLLQDIETDRQRLRYMRGVPSKEPDGQPKGNNKGDPTAAQSEHYLKLEDEVAKKEKTAAVEAGTIEEQFEKANLSAAENKIMKMKYIDGFDWSTIAIIIYGNEEDFQAKKKTYLQRIYNLRTSAMRKIAEYEK